MTSDEYYGQDDDVESALLTIFFYYVQVPTLLQIDILYQDDRYGPQRALLDPPEIPAPGNSGKF